MQVQIIETSSEVINGTTYKYFTVSCGKKTAFIGSSPDSVNVCVLNAAHRAYRGMGKFFNSFEEAIEAYKSKEMKALLAFVRDNDLTLEEHPTTTAH